MSQRTPDSHDRHRFGGLRPPFVERILLFAAASGSGLAIDFLLFVALAASGLAPGWANLVSGTAAVSFVYFASVRRIFRYGGRFLVGLFAAYLLYQAMGVALASWAVAMLAAIGWAPLLAKLAILPVTFPANYLFMSALTARGRAGPVGAGA